MQERIYRPEVAQSEGPRIKGPGPWISLLIILLPINLCSCDRASNPEVSGIASVYSAPVPIDGETQELELNIPVANRGTGDLLLQLEAVSCGCIRVESYPKRLTPGSSGSVIVKIDPVKAEYLGGFQTVLLTSNDVDKPSVLLNIRFSDGEQSTASSGFIEWVPSQLQAFSKANARYESLGFKVGRFTLSDRSNGRAELDNWTFDPRLSVRFTEVDSKCLDCPGLGSEKRFDVDIRTSEEWDRESFESIITLDFSTSVEGVTQQVNLPVSIETVPARTWGPKASRLGFVKKLEDEPDLAFTIVGQFKSAELTRGSEIAEITTLESDVDLVRVYVKLNSEAVRRLASENRTNLISEKLAIRLDADPEGQHFTIDPDVTIRVVD